MKYIEALSWQKMRCIKLSLLDTDIERGPQKPLFHTDHWGETQRMFLNDIVTVHTDNEGESQRTFCYTLIIEEGSQRKMCYTDHWEEKSKDNDTHWALRGNLKGQINTVWSLSGNLKGCCYMYTLTFDGGSQKILLHINNKRNSRMLIQILRGDLTHFFTHQHWGWVTTGKFVYSHSSSLIWVLTSWPLGVRVGHWTSVYSADWLQMSQPS